MAESLWSQQGDDPRVRPFLPIEDLDAGLYIHPHSVVVAAFTTEGEESGVVTRYYVRAEDFMDVQKERDELRRTLALVNATRVGPVEDGQRLRRIYDLCDSLGLSEASARATAGLVEWATAGGDV